MKENRLGTTSGNITSLSKFVFQSIEVSEVNTSCADAEYEVAVLDKLAAFDRSGRSRLLIFYSSLRITVGQLIDFGGATWETDHHSELIQTRHYRAPEVGGGGRRRLEGSGGGRRKGIREGRRTQDEHDKLSRSFLA
eukprot:750309-Hanusia_phi.AAC.5